MNSNTKSSEYTLSQNWKIEEFFDEHPMPFELEIFKFEGLKQIVLYCAQTVKGKYLIELKFDTWKRAQYWQRIVRNQLSLSVDVFRVKKKLFLRK